MEVATKSLKGRAGGLQIEIATIKYRSADSSVPDFTVYECSRPNGKKLAVRRGGRGHEERNVAR